MNKDATLLLIDADSARQEKLRAILQFVGIQTTIATNPQQWRAQLAGVPQANLNAVLLGVDDFLPKTQNLLAELTAVMPTVPILLLTTKEFPKKQMTSIPNGVVGYLTSPFSYAKVLTALHHCQIYKEHNISFIAHDHMHPPVELCRSLVGCSVAIAKIRELIIKVADSDANVLILGESGVGKEVAARSIHIQSLRRKNAFVPINCGAIPAELLESELFGHEKGSFTGAISARQGRFELAHQGTIFLDEIGDMPLAMQVKLLRVIQERCFERVGSSKSTHVNVRIIAATHHRLEQEIVQGSFREDLFYRLNVFPIEMPALRDRVEDLPFLINELITRIEEERKVSVNLTPQAIEALSYYPWPGNIRELANLMERLAILYPNGIVDEEELPQKFRQPAVQQHLNGQSAVHRNAKLDLKEYLNQAELQLISQVLNQTQGDMTEAAALLNIRKSALLEKARKFGLNGVEEKA